MKKLAEAPGSPRAPGSLGGPAGVAGPSPRAARRAARRTIPLEAVLLGAAMRALPSCFGRGLAPGIRGRCAHWNRRRASPSRLDAQRYLIVFVQ
jgi:hypothetical protein